MTLITWSDKLQMNIRVIDNDHRMLVDIINALHDGLQRGEDQAHIGDHLEALAHYVEEHFKREELFMEEASYPKFDEHLRQHQQLAQTVYGLVHLNETKPEEIRSPEVMDFLKSWLTDHIIKSDMHYAPYLRGRKQGVESHAHNMRAVTVRVPNSKVGLIFRCAMALSTGGEQADAIVKALRVRGDK